jgi:hypothetical protein
VHTDLCLVTVELQRKSTYIHLKFQNICLIVGLDMCIFTYILGYILALSEVRVVVGYLVLLLVR